MQQFEKMLPGKYYHVYNRGINSESIFLEKSNYQHFKMLYEKFIDPIADTYAWCLMPNHFHFLIRIFDPDRVPYPVLKVTDPSRAFSHLCNAYAQSFNRWNKRTGGLFQTPFKRKSVEDEQYFRQLVHYIHNNPVKHGFTDNMSDYPWSSFQTFLAIRENYQNDSRLIGWFDNKSDFIRFHTEQQDSQEIFHLLLE
jgi:putative transposase